MRRTRDLAGQVVVVTGAARGIGALLARRLADAMREWVRPAPAKEARR